MHYYVLDQNNKYFEFQDWFSLINWTRHNSNYVHNLKNFFGHNLNDSYTIFKSVACFEPYRETRERFLVSYVVFDELWRVVRIEDLQKAFEDEEWIRSERIKRRKWKPRRIFEYRKTPVPFTGKSRWLTWRYNVKRNKSYAAKLQEYKDLFPNDGSIKEAELLVQTWDDDLGKRHYERNWKKHSKKRKQWM